uniref:VHS domain-containing protein n=1 Tax=Oryza glumipatula TaxID=40148 RepID=A0A0D9Y5N5_9ORYZ
MDQSRRAVESYWRSRMVDGVTADDDKVAPVYKLEEICELLRASDASVVKEVADFVLKRLDNKSPVVKQKALRLIKYAVGKSGTDFKREMQRHSAAMRQLVHYKGHPDPLKGDSLNKAVRETANDAIAAIFSTEEPKPAVATEGLGKRIQGFGNTNFEPSRDDKKSFLSELSEVVGIGSASIKQGLSNFAASHSSMITNDNGGPYKSPNLRVKTREERLLDTIATSSGVRLQPTRDALQIFLTEAAKLDAVALSRALENKLNSPLWQVRMKAICVLEAIVRKQDTDPYSIITSYFCENSASVVRCCELPQVSLREKASKVLNLLVGEQPTGSNNFSETKTTVPAAQMPDLIDTGDQDDPGAQNSAQEGSERIMGNSTFTSSVDDLLGGEPIADISTTTSNGNGGDPFADVSFHETADTKDTNDLFSGMTVEEKATAALHDSSSINKNELPDIFGSSPEPFFQERVEDKGTVNDLMAGLNLNGTAQAQPGIKTESNNTVNVSQLFDMNSQTTNVANSAAMTGILGQSFYQQQQVPLQYNLPSQMLLNPAFAGQQLNYGAMSVLLAQQQQLLQNLGNFNAGLGHSSLNAMNSGNASVLPDIFNSSNQPQHVAVMSNSKKDETKAFDFVSDHLAAARGSKK